MKLSTRSSLGFLCVVGAFIVFVGHYHRSQVVQDTLGSLKGSDHEPIPQHRRLADSLRLLQLSASKKHSDAASSTDLSSSSNNFQLREPTLLAPGQTKAFKVDPERTNKLPWYPSVWPKGVNQTDVKIVNPEGTVEHEFSIRIVKNQLPRVLRLQGTLKPEEAAEIIATAKKELARSMVINHNFDKGGSEIHQVRTSFGMFLASPEQRALKANMALRSRVSKVVGIPESWIEATQVLRYEAGQFYRSHNDFFDHNDHANMNRGGQRMTTAVTWLNDVAEGGTTTFPTVGLRAQPKLGDSVMFYDTDENMREDPNSEHSGDPPGKGSEKWVAILWCHPRVFI